LNFVLRTLGFSSGFWFRISDFLETYPTMQRVSDYLRRWAARKHVRPWALSAPVAVLLICLPLLSPLRHPAAAMMSNEEMARWATVQALVEQQTFVINGTLFGLTTQRVHVADESLGVGRLTSPIYYANQPPTQGLLLAGPYWVMYHWMGLTFREHPTLVEYLLTVFAVTVPVAAAAGMIYRMGRLFDLPRPWRAGLALAVVLGSGLVSYATVLNPFAPAAALVLGAAAILVQVSRIRSPFRSGGYLASAGFFTALAAAIHPAAAPFVVLFAGVICVMRWRPSVRLGGVLMYGLGVLPPVLLHVSLSLPITGDWKLGLAQVVPHTIRLPRSVVPPPAAVDPAGDDVSLPASPTLWQTAGLYVGRLVGAALGPHGVLVHFPVLVFGLAGLWIVIRRNWPGATKGLAIATVVGSGIVLLRYVIVPVNWTHAMFAVRWYVVFLPLLLFWAGAWCRRSHHPATWATAGVLLAFSCAVSLVGATDPTPPNGYTGYTALTALRHLTAPGLEGEALAGR
jgi:hypothetical protein